MGSSPTRGSRIRNTMKPFAVSVLAETDAEWHYFFVDAEDEYAAEEKVARDHPELGYWVDWEVHRAVKWKS